MQIQHNTHTHIHTHLSASSSSSSSSHDWSSACVSGTASRSKDSELETEPEQLKHSKCHCRPFFWHLVDRANFCLLVMRPRHERTWTLARYRQRISAFTSTFTFNTHIYIVWVLKKHFTPATARTLKAYLTFISAAAGLLRFLVAGQDKDHTDKKKKCSKIKILNSDLRFLV